MTTPVLDSPPPEAALAVARQLGSEASASVVAVRQLGSEASAAAAASVVAPMSEAAVRAAAEAAIRSVGSAGAWGCSVTAARRGTVRGRAAA